MRDIHGRAIIPSTFASLPSSFVPELGAFTRISPTFIGEMERGLKAPNLQVVVAIARALHVGVDEMVAGFPTKQSIRAEVIASETPSETEAERSGPQST